MKYQTTPIIMFKIKFAAESWLILFEKKNIHIKLYPSLTMSKESTSKE